MAKDLKAGMGRGLGSLIQPTLPRQTEEPQKETVEARQTAEADAGKNADGRQRKKTTREKKKQSSVTQGLRDGFTRSTIICSIGTLAKIKEIAYLERSPQMDIIDEALAMYVSKYENKHGEVVPPAPKKRRR